MSEGCDLHIELAPDEHSALRVVVTADAAELVRLRETARRFACQHGLWPERAADIALALTEACANAILHAYPPSLRARNDVELLVDLAYGPNGVVVHVCDTGIGVDAPSARRGLGLGIGLIHSLADDVQFRSTVGKGTCVRMRFERGRRPVLP